MERNIDTRVYVPLYDTYGTYDTYVQTKQTSGTHKQNPIMQVKQGIKQTPRISKERFNPLTWRTELSALPLTQIRIHTPRGGKLVFRPEKNTLPYKWRPKTGNHSNPGRSRGARESRCLAGHTSTYIMLKMQTDVITTWRYLTIRIIYEAQQRH